MSEFVILVKKIPHLLSIFTSIIGLTTIIIHYHYAFIIFSVVFSSLIGLSTIIIYWSNYSFSIFGQKSIGSLQLEISILERKVDVLLKNSRNPTFTYILPKMIREKKTFVLDPNDNILCQNNNPFLTK
jgi:hypothetical protein